MDTRDASLSTAWKPRVILVEDDAGVRRSMQLLLHGAGFEVRSYASADTLLFDDNAGEAACLVTDYRLGGRDGIALLALLRTTGWTGPAILVTGHATPALRQLAAEAGFTAFLEKPLSERALVNTVARATGSPVPGLRG